MSSSQNLRILYIEDNLGEAYLVKKSLNRHGYNVTVAHDGAQGLTLAQKTKNFDAILIDQSLPSLEGLEILRLLHNQDPTFPLIMITGHGDEATAVQAMKLGAKDYVVKDVGNGYIELLSTVINQAVAQQQLLLEKQRLEQVAHRREAILEAVANAAEQLLKTNSWQNHISYILTLLGEATSVSRVYLVENDLMATEPTIKQCFEWVDQQITSRIQVCVGKSYHEIGLDKWLKAFTNGQTIQGLTEQLPLSMHSHLLKEGVKSLIIMPIFMGSTWWGFIGFDDCQTERQWDLAEIDALKVAANILGAALQRQQAENSLYQAQKLESIGLLAGGVAHDFNNLLTGILSQSSLALTMTSADARAHKHIGKAIHIAEQAADLVSQLLGFAGKGQYKVQAVNLSELVKNNAELLKTAVRKEVGELHLELDPDLPAIEADRSQIQQIIMNLVVNAAEAINGPAGSIKITTYSVESSQPIKVFSQEPLPPGRYVGLEVLDKGRGLKPEIMHRIFDPFFTTKQNGRGLGLSATLGIVQSHHGGIQVESEEGKGSVFRIYFPVSNNTAATVEATSNTASVRHNLHGRILLIDDEQVVRDAVKDTLEIMGATVLVASDGHKGLDLYRQHHAHIDLIILDMQMPGLSGRETLPHLKAINPHLKVILSSGYSEAETIRSFKDEAIISFLQKPYRLEKLLTEIQAALAA